MHVVHSLGALVLGVVQVEPEPGQYNKTYLQLMTDLVRRAYQYGIYTVLDFHQVGASLNCFMPWASR